jgi:hypothetical protein
MEQPEPPAAVPLLDLLEKKNGAVENVVGELKSHGWVLVALPMDFVSSLLKLQHDFEAFLQNDQSRRMAYQAQSGGRAFNLSSSSGRNMEVIETDRKEGIRMFTGGRVSAKNATLVSSQLEAVAQKLDFFLQGIMVSISREAFGKKTPWELDPAPLLFRKDYQFCLLDLVHYFNAPSEAKTLNCEVKRNFW